MAGIDFPARYRRLRIAALALALALAAPARAALPGFPQVKAAWRASDTLLLDRHGETLQEIRADEKVRRADWTPLADTSPALIAAVLRAEDQRFFRHAGVDWLAAAKAALTNWLNDKPRGASTLSMQLAALLDPRYRAHGSRRDVPEKLRQMEAGQALERAWSKAEILEAYLNLIPLRGGLTGIDAAARSLFDKRPASLGDGEALILAALIRSPNAKPKDVVRRVCTLATHTKGAPGCTRLKRLTLATLARRPPLLPAANLAPQLMARLNPHPGEKYRTSLDAGLQRFVADTLGEQLRRLAARNLQEGAALVLENASGRVLAYVSASGAGSPSPHGDGVQAPRQAGATLQPFLYAQALDQRLLTAASPLADGPLAIATPDGQSTPQNHDASQHGPVSVRLALAGSLDIPALNALQRVGPEPFAGRLAQLDFAGLDEAADRPGDPLALDGLDVRLGELANAYRALANEGRASPLSFKPDGAPAPGQRLYSREAAWLVGDILADRQARALGLEHPPATRYWTAVKTGTGQDLRDHWCVGYSEHYTVGVRIGNLNGRHEASGSAAPAWTAIMDRLHATQPSTQPKPPKGLVRKPIQPDGEAPRLEWFLAGTEPVEATWNPAHPPAQILSPSHGSILALDPDIPPEQQRLGFQARNAPDGAYWVLDGVRQESGDWKLARGHHRLILFDASGRGLDQVEFEVR